jgi:C1A family cysteine protease
MPCSPPHKYGWLPDPPDQRDHLYAAPSQILGELPSETDLTGQCPAVYDQGDLNSCTAAAIGAAIAFARLKQQLTSLNPSRLFIYYNERAIEGNVRSDAGASIRDGIKSVATQGVCSEEMWTYNPANFAMRPPRKCYASAVQHKVESYQRLGRNLTQMKGCLASGYPFVFGFTVYESFESSLVAKTGHAPLPKPTDKVLGGHAVVAVGYDDAQLRFIARNSWGAGWGMKGYFTMPYAYLLEPDLSDDFWTIRTVQ